MAATIIKLTFSTVDRFRETRTFKTLKGARKYAQGKIGTHPEVSRTFGYAVSSYGDAKIEIREGCTFAELFPSEEDLIAASQEAAMAQAWEDEADDRAARSFAAQERLNEIDDIPF